MKKRLTTNRTYGSFTNNYELIVRFLFLLPKRFHIVVKYFLEIR